MRRWNFCNLAWFCGVSSSQHGHGAGGCIRIVHVRAGASWKKPGRAGRIEKRNKTTPCSWRQHNRHILSCLISINATSRGYTHASFVSGYTFVLNQLHRQTRIIKMLPELFFAGRKRSTTRPARFLFFIRAVSRSCFSLFSWDVGPSIHVLEQIPSVSDREYVMPWSFVTMNDARHWVRIHRCIDGQCFWPARGGPNLCRHQCPRYGFSPIDSSLRIRMAGLTSDQYLESGSDFHEMRDRLCPHIHNLTFNYLWDHHWKALRSRHFPHAVQTGSSYIQN